MIEIVLDTETTGLDPLTGDRIVEIGCVKLENHIATGETYHQYINPERSMPAEAFNVHGLGDEFLSTKPVFAEIAGDFLDFLGDAKLVIHNAAFDMKFINAELKRLGMPVIPMSRSVDTLAMARARFPGAQVTLDALCRRYGIDNSNRTLHGALLDSELLAEVYLELCGGRQPGLVLGQDANGPGGAASGGGRAAIEARASRAPREPRRFRPSDEELAAHKALLESLDDALWLNEDAAKQEKGA